MKLVIDKFNVNAGLADKFRSVIYNSSMWHKIMVENAQDSERDFVLKTLMSAVHPLDFIPVSYAVSPEHISFLLKNCGAALECLCRRNLVIPNPNNKDKPFFVSIELCVANASELKINVQSNVVSVIQKRLSADGVLNLEQFYKDSSLYEFCPLSQPKLMFFILHLSKTYNVKVLKLGNNQIEILKPLEAIYGVKSLVCLDLRNNNISKVSELRALKDLSITELWLDGNPVCEEYDEFTYGRAMQEIISGLVKLDGFTVMKKGGFMPFRRNFLCNIEGQELVDQFLEHYFTLYDSPNRNVLGAVYHKQAMFSLTSRYLIMQSTSQNAKLNSYSQFSRNIKQISDFSKNDLYLFKGPQSILKILNALPRTEHDPYTFTVDLMTYTDTTAVIVVTGVFQEISESELNVGRQLGFVRTFVLLAGQNGEYAIVNEQLHVSNATTVQTLKAFKIPRPRKLNYIQIPPPQNLKERYELIEAMRIITGLNMEWSKNCLEDAQYNLKNALTTFVELYKLDKIPQSAFDRENETETAQQNSELRKLPETLLIAKDSNKTFNKVHNTSAYKFDLEPISPPVEQVPKIAKPEVAVSSSKSIAQKAEDADDIFELSYMNDDGISTISDNSNSRREVIVRDHGASLPLEHKAKSLDKDVLKTIHPKESTTSQTVPKSNMRQTPTLNALVRKANLAERKMKTSEVKKIVSMFKLTLLQKKDTTQACEIANSLINKYGITSIQPWHHVMNEFYKFNPELARQYVIKGRKLLRRNLDAESPPFITQQSTEEAKLSEISDKTESSPSTSQKKEVTRYRAPLPGTLDKVKKLDFKKKILKFKTSLALDDYKNADLLLEELAKEHGSEVYIWRKVLSFCYKQDLKIARQFVTTIKTANPYCINGVVFNSVIAEQECRYGDSALGRKTFEKLASQYSERILHHFVPYLHYLCDVKDFSYARNFLKKNIHKVEHHYNLAKLKKEVKILEAIYHCRLL